MLYLFKSHQLRQKCVVLTLGSRLCWCQDCRNAGSEWRQSSHMDLRSVIYLGPWASHWAWSLVRWPVGRTGKCHIPSFLSSVFRLCLQLENWSHSSVGQNRYFPYETTTQHLGLIKLNSLILFFTKHPPGHLYLGDLGVTLTGSLTSNSS